MSILNFFKRKDSQLGNVPSISSSTAASVSRNVAVALKASTSRERGSYQHYSQEEKLQIGRHAALYSNASAVRAYAKKTAKEISESTVRTFKSVYHASLKSGTITPETPMEDLAKDAPPPPKRGRKTLLGDLEKDLMDCLKALRTANGIVNSSIVRATALGIVESKNPGRLEKNGGDLDFSKDWANKFLTRMGWTKRRAITSKGKDPADFPELKERMLSQLESAVTEHHVPKQLVVNWDQTAIHFIPVSNYTMNESGAANINVAGIDDKREFTAVLAGAADGTFLPPQLIFDGLTDRCHPKLRAGVTWPEHWDVTHNKKHWSNEDSMIRYVCSTGARSPFLSNIDISRYFHNVLLPYRSRMIDISNLPEDQKMVCLFDVFRGQWTDRCKQFLSENNIVAIQVPPNCTDKLQPMDLSINKPLKTVMKDLFQTWYSEEVATQISSGTAANAVKVDVRTSIVKPLCSEWLIAAVTRINREPHHVVTGFEKAGIIQRIWPEEDRDDSQ
jgi:hypothetical protein